MGRWAFIRMPDPGVDRLELAIEGGSVASVSGAEAAGVIAQRRVAVVVDGTDVLLTWARPPRTSRRNQERAIPYLLEESLADPVDQLHFAVGRAGTDGQLPVAVTASQRMESWLARLKELGVRPDVLISETLLVPWRSDEWTVLASPGRLLVRTGPDSGLAMEPENGVLMLEMALAEADPQQRPERIRLLDHQAAPDVVADLGRLMVPLAVEKGRGEPFAALRREAPGLDGLNLLQGPFGFQEQWGEVLRPFRLTVLFILVWAAIQGLDRYLSNQELWGQVQAVEQRIEEVFRQAFPGTRVVSPEIQMGQNLARLRQEAGGNRDFLVLLTQVGPPILAQPGTRIERIRFQNDALDLFLTARDLQQINAIKREVESASGLRVTIQSALKRDNRVEGRLRIEGGQ